MPKSRLLNNSNNHYDDNELLIPNHNHNNHRIDEKKSAEPSVHQQKQLSSSSSSNKSYAITDGISKTSTSHASNATATNRSSTRSTSKSTRPVSSTASATAKPNTILSLEDRDIVVIDNVDYKESEGTVIVVEKPRKVHKSVDVDLADLLETNWPSMAGDMALALNNRSSSGAQQYSFSSGSTSTSNSSISCQQSASNPINNIITERNRSKNPLAHFGHSKVKRNMSSNTNNFATTGNLINLDSDGSSASGSFELNSSKYTKKHAKTFLSILFVIVSSFHWRICVYRCVLLKCHSH